MRLAMISCAAYSDCWIPFRELLDHFWSNHPPIILITDTLAPGLIRYDEIVMCNSPQWCEVLTAYCEDLNGDEVICLLQDDFWLNAPVHPELIERGLEQMKAAGAGCVRLYPCPGGDEEYGDPHFAIVPRGTRYRVSLQCSLWNVDYLRRIASRFRTPQEFELEGTPFSDTLPEEVLAWKRDVTPTPVSYICTSIVRGEWLPEAKELCEREGITGVDWTRRPFRAA